MVQDMRLIELKGISKSFDGTEALSDVNLYIRKCEFITLLGPSGCGKTTMLRIIGGFEFPVPDGLELYDGWEIGYRQPSLIVNVYNSGDVKSGIRIEFRAIGAVTNPVLLNVDTREFIKLNISLVAGDVLTVSTGYGEKAVKLNRGGTITDAFRYLDVDSSYLQIAVGDNLFRYSADANAENLEVSIYHNNLYLGV